MNDSEKRLFNFAMLPEAEAFIGSLPENARRKILYNIGKVAAGIKDTQLFKKLDNTDIWEFRTLFGGLAYRLFAFWDKGENTFVIATHGMVKKTQKTPAGEIRRAESIRHKYFEEK